ncbi:uncharacterized protein LOC114298496 isoform X2 [Camellia sinensis]|uniref:uncharacterized protein LOC114298496 isoform X2 n=1 Tax=Camellia sinensis TaxID=4442 RepID=UPI0010356D50|nr:uncharacterized protein LOC114298496 isoform X2 [Camellia sinensis]
MQTYRASFGGTIWIKGDISQATEVYFNEKTPFHLKKFPLDEEPKKIVKALRENWHPNFANISPIFQAFPSTAMEGGDSNWLFMIAKAVAALTLQAMSYVGFCTLEKLLPESAYNIVRESYFNVVVRFVLSVFDMEDFERIYELSIVKDECSTYYSNLCNAHCGPCVAVAEGKVKVEKFSTLREHDICDTIQGCAENKGFEVYPWAFPFDPDKWDDISQSDIISAMREVLKYVPLKEDCKMQLTLELSRPKCYHILDNLTLEAVKDVKIQELHRFVDDVSSDESIAEDAKTMLYDFANGIIDGLYVLSDFKGDALIYFQEAIIFPISRGSFGPCTDELRGVINIADNERRMQCQRFISVQHILFGLSFSRVGDNVRMLNDRPRCSGGLHSKLSMFSIYKLSRIAADRLGDKEVGLEHLVLAIFFGKQEDDPIKRVELEYGSSLFFDDNAFDPELVDCEKQHLLLFFGESILHNGYITVVYTSPTQTYGEGFHMLVI